MTIPCQASKEEGVTTIGSSPSTTAIGTPLEVPTNYFNNSNFQPFLFHFLKTFPYSIRDLLQWKSAAASFRELKVMVCSPFVAIIFFLRFSILGA